MIFEESNSVFANSLAIAMRNASITAGDSLDQYSIKQLAGYLKHSLTDQQSSDRVMSVLMQRVINELKDYTISLAQVKMVWDVIDAYRLKQLDDMKQFVQRRNCSMFFRMYTDRYNRLLSLELDFLRDLRLAAGKNPDLKKYMYSTSMSQHELIQMIDEREYWREHRVYQGYHRALDWQAIDVKRIEDTRVIYPFLHVVAGECKSAQDYLLALQFLTACCDLGKKSIRAENKIFDLSEQWRLKYFNNLFSVIDQLYIDEMERLAEINSYDIARQDSRRHLKFASSAGYFEPYTWLTSNLEVYTRSDYSKLRSTHSALVEGLAQQFIEPELGVARLMASLSVARASYCAQTSLDAEQRYRFSQIPLQHYAHPLHVFLLENTDITPDNLVKPVSSLLSIAIEASVSALGFIRELVAFLMSVPCPPVGIKLQSGINRREAVALCWLFNAYPESISWAVEQTARHEHAIGNEQAWQDNGVYIARLHSGFARLYLEQVTAGLSAYQLKAILCKHAFLLPDVYRYIQRVRQSTDVQQQMAMSVLIKLASRLDANIPCHRLDLTSAPMKLLQNAIEWLIVYERQISMADIDAVLAWCSPERGQTILHYCKQKNNQLQLSLPTQLVELQHSALKKLLYVQPALLLQIPGYALNALGSVSDIWKEKYLAKECFQAISDSILQGTPCLSRVRILFAQTELSSLSKYPLDLLCLLHCVCSRHFLQWDDERWKAAYHYLLESKQSTSKLKRLFQTEKDIRDGKLDYPDLLNLPADLSFIFIQQFLLSQKALSLASYGTLPECQLIQLFNACESGWSIYCRLFSVLDSSALNENSLQEARKQAVTKRYGYMRVA